MKPAACAGAPASRSTPGSAESRILHAANPELGAPVRETRGAPEPEPEPPALRVPAGRAPAERTAGAALDRRLARRHLVCTTSGRFGSRRGGRGSAGNVGAPGDERAREPFVHDDRAEDAVDALDDPAIDEQVAMSARTRRSTRAAPSPPRAVSISYSTRGPEDSPHPNPGAGVDRLAAPSSAAARAGGSIARSIGVRRTRPRDQLPPAGGLQDGFPRVVGGEVRRRVEKKAPTSAPGARGKEMARARNGGAGSSRRSRRARRRHAAEGGCARG